MSKQNRLPTDHQSPIRLLVCTLPALVALLIFAFYVPVIENGFVWDDNENFLESTNYRSLSLSNIWKMFTTLHWGLYQPVSVLSHALVHSVWGVNPIAFHVTNVALHAANGVLVYFLVLALLRPHALGCNALPLYAASAVGALFFALHPLRVEVVAWATERREILCAFFLIPALLTYLRMQERRTLGDPAWRRWYILSIVFFVLSLLSKAQGMTFPVTLLILDAYPLGRLNPRRTITNHHRLSRTAVLLEKVPYAVFALAAATIALLAQLGGSTPAPWEYHGAVGRLLQAAYGLFFYIEKTVLPIGLSPLYLLHLPLDLTRVSYWLSAAAIVGVTTGLFILRRRYPWALVAWGCYAVTVSPMLGFAQMGPQIAADRYTYLSCLPWAVLAAGGVHRFWLASQGDRWHRLTTSAGLAVVGLLLIVLGVRTYAQTQVWKDDLVLWNHVIEVEPDNYYAYNNRGYERLYRGDLRGAISDFDLVCVPRTPYVLACAGRAEARRRMGDMAGALADYELLLRLNPRSQIAYASRGDILQMKNDIDGALASYRQANRLAPTAMVHNKIAKLLRLRADWVGALREWRAATRLEPSNYEAWHNLARLLDQLGRVDEALQAYHTFLETAPKSQHVLAGLVRQRVTELISAQEKP